MHHDPPPPCKILGWEGVSWSFRPRGNGGEQQLLHGLSGRALAGEVLAIMGPSGAGKTTLLDILALRKTLGRVEGTVCVDGRSRRPGAFQRASAYVPHEDAFLPTLTVMETLQYYAGMRLSPLCSRKEKRLRVQEVLSLVGLQKSARTPVGGVLPGGLSLRGISGGEKKRLNIAAGMISEPTIVFADEPTSGLDTHASLKVLQVLKDVAARDKVVLLTVHQPRSAIWQLFDQLYLLSEGRLMYIGPTSGAAPWFNSLGYVAPEGSSPADWLLDMVSVGYDAAHLSPGSLKDMTAVAKASSRFESSDLMERIKDEVLKACHGQVPDAGSWPRSKHEDDVGPITRGLARGKTLLWRHALNYSRNLGNVAARLSLSGASGLIVGFCYSGLRYVDETDPRMIPDRLGALFFMCIVLMITPNCTTALFASERRLYVAESAAHLYGPVAYYVTFAICELALNVAAAGLFWAPVWALSGLRGEGDSFVMGLMLCSLIQLLGAQIVNCSVLLLKNQELAFVLSVAINIFAFITSGFLVRTPDLIAGVRMLRFFSPVKLGFQALALNELASRPFGATRQLEELAVELGKAGSSCSGDVGSPAAWWLRQGPLRGAAVHFLGDVLPCMDPCVTGMVETGREALDCLSLDEPGSVVTSVLGMVVQLLTLHIVGLLCLRHLSEEKR